MAAVDNLRRHFETIINRTLLAYDLRNCRDPADRETLRIIELDIRHMEKAITELKKVITNGKTELAEMHALTQDVRELTEVARHMSENIPESLSRVTSNVENLGDHELAPRVAENGASRQVAAENSKENKAPSNPLPSKVSNIPLILPLTSEEYNETPKYMLGRITHALLNKTVQDINLTMTEKYRLLKKKQKDKTPQEIRLVQTFKKQENPESQGAYFILAEDLKVLGVSTDGFNSRQFAAHLPILRHHRRIREIRGGGHTRLAIC